MQTFTIIYRNSISGTLIVWHISRYFRWQAVKFALCVVRSLKPNYTWHFIIV